MDKNEHPLRKMRATYDLSIDVLADETGLSARTILRAEQGCFIYPSSRRLICSYFTRLLGQRVTSRDLGLVEDEDSTTTSEREEMDNLRRDLLHSFGIAGAALCLPSLVTVDLLEQLTSAATKPSGVDTAILSQVEKLLKDCWQLTNGTEVALIEQTLPDCLPQIATLAQHFSKHQQWAANLAAQGYLLACLVALDRFNLPAIERYSQQAVSYSQLANDSNLHAAALKQQATMFLILKQPAKALQTYQQALPFIHQVSPLLRSRIYQGLASASARFGTDGQEAERYIGLAYEVFPSDFEHDPSFLYADSGLSVLYMYDGLTRLDLDQPSEAWEAFAKVEGLSPKIPIGEGTRLEFLNLQVLAAIALRDQERSSTYLMAAVELAERLTSRYGRTEAFDAYQKMRLVWQREPRVRVLGQLFAS